MNIVGSILVGSCLALVDIALVLGIKKSLRSYRQKITNLEIMGAITGTAEYYYRELSHVPVVTYSHDGKTYQRIPYGAERLVNRTFAKDQPIKIFINPNVPDEPSFTPWQLANPFNTVLQIAFIGVFLLAALFYTVAYLLLISGRPLPF